MIRHTIIAMSLGLALGSAKAQSVPSTPAPPTGASTVFVGNAAFDAFIPFLQTLPLPSCNGTSWSNMVGGMRNGLVRMGASNWYQNSGACGIKFLVYNHLGAVNKFAAFVVRDGTTNFSDMPYVQGESWSGFADAVFTDTIFSYSTDDLSYLTTTDLQTPELLRAKFGAGQTYSGMTQLRVPEGGQLFTRASIAGELGNILSGPINLPTNNLWLRSEFKAKKNEILLPPGQTFSGPLGMTPITLSDVTFSIDQARNMSFMGNASFQRLPGKVLPMVIDSPAAVPGAWPRNWPASQIALNAPRTLGLNDYVNLIADLATQGPQAASQVSFINSIVPTADLLNRLQQLSQPLGTFRMINPDANADTFRLAAGTAYPNLGQFNFVLLGAQARAKDGTNTQGPLLRFKAQVQVFGQNLATSDTLVSKTTFQTNSSGGFNIGLQGITSPSVDAVVDVGTSPARANIALKVKSPVRNFDFVFNETRISANSPANCALPVNLNASLNIQGATAQSLASGLVPSPPNAQLAVDCALAIGNLAAQAAEAAGQAANYAANAVAGGATAAANAVANGVSNFVSNPGAAINSVVNAISGNDKNVCNQRIEWLRARGNRPDRGEVNNMIATIYQPMKVNADTARANAVILESYAAHSAFAHLAYQSIEQYWNAHPLKTSALPAFTSFHQASNTNVFNYVGVVNALRSNADILDRGNKLDNSTILKHLVDWLPYSGFETDGPWYGRNDPERFWARCAAAWIADLPMRSADAWGITYPKHQGRFSDAMFMGRPDYLTVRSKLAQVVASHGQNNSNQIAMMNSFASNWVNSSKNFYLQLLNKAIEGVPIQPGEVGSAQTRYNTAAHRLKNEAVEILKLESKVHACQVIRTLDNLLRAKEEVKTGRRPTIGAVIPPQCGPANYPRPNNDERFAVLDPLWYLGNHPDVRQVFGNTIAGAQAHWIQYGINEGRAASWNFHAPTYASLHPDLPAGYGATNWHGMTFHWIQHGIREGRATVRWLD